MTDSRLKIVLEVDSKTGEATIKIIGDEARRAGEKAEKAFSKSDIALKRLNSALSTLKKRAGSALASLSQGALKCAKNTIKLGAAATAAATAFAAWKLAGVAGSFVTVAASAEKTRIMLERLTGSAQKGEKAFQWTMDLRVPFGLQSLQDSFVKLKAVGLDPMGGSLGAITDAVAAFGGGSEKLKQASVAIMQMAGKGVISMEELRQQLSEAIPTAAQVMARELGMSFRDMVDTISKGNLDSVTGLNALFTGLKKDYEGAAEELMKSWDGMWIRIQRIWAQWRILVMDSGPFEALKGYFQEVLDKIEELKDKGKLAEYAKKTGAVILEVFAQVIEVLGGVPSTFLGIIEVVSKTTAFLVAMGQAAVNSAMALAAIAAPANAIKLAFHGWDATFPKLSAMYNKLDKIGTKLYAVGESARKSEIKWDKFGDGASKIAENLRKKVAGMRDLAAAGDETTGQLIEGMDYVSDSILYATDNTGLLAIAMEKLSADSVNLYEELYDTTGIEEYAEKAIAAHSKILDKDEAKWAKVLGNAREANILRTKKENEYADSVYNVLDDIVAADRNAADDRIRIAEDLADSQIRSAERSGTAQAKAGSSKQDTGLTIVTPHSSPTMMVPNYFSGGWKSVPNPNYDYTQTAAYASNQEAAALQLKAAGVQAAGTEKLAEEQERLADQLRREHENRVRAFEGVHGQYTGFIQERERKDWGVSDYNAALESLMSEFQNAEYYEDSLDILGEMVDTLRTIEGLEQKAMSEYRAQTDILQGAFGSLGSMIETMGFSDLAPVESEEQFSGRYVELLTAAKTEGDADAVAASVQEFITYVPEFLSFMGDYGGDYASIYQSVMDDLKLLQVDIGIDVLKRKITTGDLFEIIPEAVLVSDLLNLDLATPKTVLTSDLVNIDLAAPRDVLVSDLINFDFTALEANIDAGNIPAATAQLQELTNFMGINLPAAADDALGGTAAGLYGLANAAVNLKPVSDTSSTSLGNMTKTVQQQLGAVGGFFDTLATKMGLTFSSGSAQTAISNLTPPPVTITAPAAVTVVGTIETSPYIQEEGYWMQDYVWGNPVGEKYFVTTTAGASAHGFILYSDGTKKYYADGGLTDGEGIAGEIGPEWVVPTYEPHRSKFLKDVGADPAQIGAAVARTLAPMLQAQSTNNSGGGTTHVHINIDGKEIGDVIATQINEGNTDLIQQIRSVN